MIQCKSILVAEHILIDMFSKKVSVFNVLEDSNISGNAVFNLSAFLVFKQSKDNKNLTPELFLDTKFDDKQLIRTVLQAQFHKGNPFARNLAKIGVVQIPQTGVLSFHVVDEKGRELVTQSYEMTQVYTPFKS